MIRSHSRTLVSSHVIAAFALNACGLGSAPDHAALLLCFRPGGAERLLTECPFTAARRCILAKSVAKLEGANGHALALLRERHARRSGAEASRGCGGRTRTCAAGSEPRLVVSRTPPCHPAGAQRVGTTRYVLTMGRRPARSAAGRPLRSAAASVTRPAKGEILVTDRGAFSPSDRLPRVGAK